MGNANSDAAAAAAAGFVSAIDALAKLAKGAQKSVAVNPLDKQIAAALSGLSTSVAFTGAEQVAARPVGDMSQDRSNGIT